MKTLLALLLGAVSVVPASQSLAAERVSDPVYLQAARCSGLIRANGGDPAAADAFLKAQSTRRTTDVRRSAQTIRRTVERDMRKGGETGDQLAAEFTRYCGAYAAGAQVAAGSSAQSVR